MAKINKHRSERRKNFGRTIGSARHIKQNLHRSDRKAAKWELDLCRVDDESPTKNISVPCAESMTPSQKSHAESVSTAA